MGFLVTFVLLTVCQAAVVHSQDVDVPCDDLVCEPCPLENGWLEIKKDSNGCIVDCVCHYPCDNVNCNDLQECIFQMETCENNKDKDCPKTSCKAIQKWGEGCPDFAKLTPMKGIDSDLLQGLWYNIRWYYGTSQDASMGMNDVTVYFNQRKGDQIRAEYNFRFKGDTLCQDTDVRNFTMVSQGINFQLKPYAATSFFLWTDYDNFLMEFICYHVDLPEMQCRDIGVEMWSRDKKARQANIDVAEGILSSICYPDLNRFLKTKHQMDCRPVNW